MKKEKKDLTEIKRNVIIFLRMRNLTYEEIGKILNISRQRVFQVLTEKKICSRISSEEKKEGT